MRAPTETTIAAPSFLTHLKWVNVPTVRLDRLKGPMLVEFWDFCRPNSLRTLPYLKAWHERYATEGLCVVGIHCPGFEPGHSRQEVKDAVARLGISYPVLIDSELEMWELYGNQGWPARYLFDAQQHLFEYHYGEGAYRETELAIQELLGVARALVDPIHPEDIEGAVLEAQTADLQGPYSGPYEAGGVWAIFHGSGTVQVNGIELAVTHPGAYPLIEHERHTEGVLDLELGDGVQCLATCFTPGVC